MRHAAQLVTGGMHKFRVAGLGDVMTSQSIDFFSRDAGAHGLDRSLDGLAHGCESLLDVMRRISFAGFQKVRHTLQVGTITRLADAKINMQNMPGPDAVGSRRGMSDRVNRARC